MITTDTPIKWFPDVRLDHDSDGKTPEQEAMDSTRMLAWVLLLLLGVMTALLIGGAWFLT